VIILTIIKITALTINLTDLRSRSTDVKVGFYSHLKELLSVVSDNVLYMVALKQATMR